MSKIYEKYLKMKLNDKNKIYLFKSGIFYISLGEDANVLSEKYNLNLLPFNKEIDKCGFPIKSLDKYLKMFDSDNLNYEVVKETDKEGVIKILEKVDIDTTSPVDALIILKRMKDLLWQIVN